MATALLREFRIDSGVGLKLTDQQITLHVRSVSATFETP